MKRSSTEFKQLARSILQGNYGTFVGTYVLCLVIIYLASMLSVFIFPGNDWSTIITRQIVNILFSIVTGIFPVGLLWQSLSASRGNSISVSNLVHGFKHHPDRFIVVQLISSLISLVCQLPAIALLAYMYVGRTQSLGHLAALTLTHILPLIALYFIGGIVSYIIWLRFSLTSYLLLDNDDMSTLTALRTSAALMKGHKLRYFYLYLSFFGLSLLATLSCGIGYLWVGPYMTVTMTQFYREVAGELSPRCDAPYSTFDGIPPAK